MIEYFKDKADANKDIIIHAKNFWVMIPRLTSSIMMHLECISSMRNGLLLMKFALNHPYYFNFCPDILKKDDNDKNDQDKDKDDDLGNVPETPKLIYNSRDLRVN